MIIQASHHGRQSAGRGASVTLPSTQSYPTLVSCPKKCVIHTIVHRCVSKCVCFFPNREGKGLLAPGGQCAICLVCDRGASQLSTAATNTRVRVRFHTHLVVFNHIQLARMTTTYFPIRLPFLDKILMGFIVNKNLFDSFRAQ